MTDAASTLENKYTLEALIGRGGGGSVWRARQHSTGQRVAIKLLELDAGLDARSQERRRQRFRREMRICGRLDHPDIVRLVDYGEHDDTLYAAFEFVRGRTLAAALETDGALPVTTAFALMRQLLEVVAHAHEHGVIHRDLKPSNLMILDGAASRRLKVLDFGVSAVPSGTSSTTLTRLTLSHEMVGTPAYAAPEQLRGDTPSPRTDIYAWGLVSLECLTGSCPMSGSSLGEIFQKQLSPAPVPIPARLKAHDLGVILSTALEKNPQRRAGSAADLLARLDRVDVNDLCDVTGYFVARTPSTARLDSETSVTRTAPSLRGVGERRHVTALCCRVSLRTEGDEDVEAALLDAYRQDVFALCDTTIEGFGGVAIGVVGEFALYAFGLPRARDKDAHMAARAVLEFSARLRSRSLTLTVQRGVSVTLRAGLHSGLTTVDERGLDSFAHGDVAATACALAERALARNQAESTLIVVSDVFRRLTTRHVEFAEQSHEVTEALTLPWRVAQLSTHTLIGESLAGVVDEDSAPLVGRDEQLRSIVESWRASSERGRVVLIRGEAGIGKSRLAYEFQRVARDRGCRGLTLRFLPDMENVALGSLLELVRAELGLPLARRPTCSELVEALTIPGVALDTAGPLLCAWMSIPLESPYEPLPYAPQKQRLMLYELLVTIVSACVERRSGYLLVEDLHWADPSTLDWLGRMFGALREHGRFALLSARPGFSPSWQDIEVHTIALDSLDAEQAAALVSGLPVGEGLSAPIVEEIVARADGVPLFVEELVHAFHERLANAPTGAPLPDVPISLSELMTSRLDSLGAAKETAQRAAAIGREFDLELLRHSHPGRDEATVRADLEQLVTFGIVLMRRRVGAPTYLFRHALLRDAAYESLTEKGRRTVHDGVAQALLDLFPERVETRPDEVARHLERAGRNFEAQGHWLSAGRGALKDLAHDEARTHFQHGLRALKASDRDASSLRGAELDLLAGLSAALVAKRGYGADELSQTLARTRALIETSGTPRERAIPMLWLQYLKSAVEAKWANALSVAEEIGSAAACIPAAPFSALGHSAMARASFWSGDFVATETHGLRVAPEPTSPSVQSLYPIAGENIYFATHTFIELSRLIRGQLTRGIDAHNQLTERARELKLTAETISLLAQTAFAMMLSGMHEPTGESLQHAGSLAGESLTMATEMGFPFWQAHAKNVLSAIQIFQGREEGVQGLEQGIAIYRFAGASVGYSWHGTCLAHGYILRGEFDRARETAAGTRSFIETSGERFFESPLLLLEGRIARVTEQSGDLVTEKLRAAAHVAAEQGARLFEAQAIIESLEHSTPGAREGDLRVRSATEWWRALDVEREQSMARRLASLH